MPLAIKLKNISKVFREAPGRELAVLKNINLEVKAGEFFCFVGPSGSGKSTLLRIMSGLEKDYGGEIVFGPQLNKQDFSFVFQQFALLPWMTVYQNVEIGLIARGLSPAARDKIVSPILKQLDLLKFAQVYPRELSGGMKQRVGVARALSTSPKIIFMDEPFSELDSFTAKELRREVLNVWQNKKITIIMVTHIIEDAVEMADRIAALTPRPGRIEKMIENNLPRPRDRRSPEFFSLADEVEEVIRP